MDDDNTSQTAELAAIYDAIYAGRDDAGFWREIAAAAGGGPILELGCGTGRVLLPLARAGFEITGLDLSAADARALPRQASGRAGGSARARTSARRRHDVVRPRPRASRRSSARSPASSSCARSSSSSSCLERCRAHLLPHGRLVLDLPNPDPAPAEYARDEARDGEATAQVVDWTDGRRIRWWMTVIGYDRLQQCNECEVTYEIVEADGATRRMTETLVPALHVPLRARASARARRLSRRRPLRRLRPLAVRGRIAGADRRGRTRGRLSSARLLRLGGRP